MHWTHCTKPQLFTKHHLKKIKNNLQKCPVWPKTPINANRNGFQIYRQWLARFKIKNKNCFGISRSSVTRIQVVVPGLFYKQRGDQCDYCPPAHQPAPAGPPACSRWPRSGSCRSGRPAAGKTWVEGGRALEKQPAISSTGPQWKSSVKKSHVSLEHCTKVPKVLFE